MYHCAGKFLMLITIEINGKYAESWVIYDLGQSSVRCRESLINCDLAKRKLDYACCHEGDIVLYGALG